MGSQDDNLLELLELYMDMVEKQERTLNSYRMTVNFRIKSWKRIWLSLKRSWSSIRKPKLN